MRNRKLERALYGPTIYEVTFGVILSVLLGAVLAIAFLIFKPAQTVQEMPKEDERIRGATYYITGNTDSVKSKQWMRKRQMLLESSPGDILFSEEDLNEWFMSSTEAGKKIKDKQAKEAAAAEAAAKKPAKPAPASANNTKPGTKPADAKQPADAPAEGAAPEAPPEELITPSVINFRIRDGQVQLGLPSTVNIFNYQFSVVVQAKGGFEKRDDMYVFVPDELMIGSLPVHCFPNAVEYLMKKAMASEALPPELMAAWKKVKTVVVDGKIIKLTI